MLNFPRSFIENINFFSEKERNAFESAIQNQQRTSLFEIRETERMVEYLEVQPRFFQYIYQGQFEKAFFIFKDKIMPAWQRTVKKGKLNIFTLYSIQVIMLADTAVQCGVPYNIAYMHAYTYLLHLSSTDSEDEALYLSYRAIFEYFDMIQEFQEKGSLSDIVMSALNFIQTHLHQKLTIDDIAYHVNISPRQLTRKFKAEMKQTIVDYINGQRVFESEYMLIHSDVPITDIALSIGFSSESYFINVFKSIKGITPNAYRKSLPKN